MKKALSILAAAMLVPLLSSSVSAQGTAEAYSANAVGVVKYVLPAGGVLVCATLPLTPIDDPRGDGSWLWGDTALAEQLDVGSTVYFWSEGRWQDFTKVASNPIQPNGWKTAANKWELKQGEAFFLRGDKDATYDKTISLLGQLPTDEEYDYDLTGSKNLDAKGATVYPVSVNFGSTDLAEQLEVGDSVYFWSDGRWQDFTKVTSNPIQPNGWKTAANNWNVGVGQGIFVKRVADGSTNIVHSRPFEW